MAEVKSVDSLQRQLPEWTGCVLLDVGHVFLLNENPNSLDGRYFGATNKGDLLGMAHKVDLF